MIILEYIIAEHHGARVITIKCTLFIGLDSRHVHTGNAGMWTPVNSGEKWRTQPKLLHLIMQGVKAQEHVPQKTNHLATFADQVWNFSATCSWSTSTVWIIAMVRDALPHRSSICTLQMNTLQPSQSLVFPNSHLHTLSYAYTMLNTCMRQTLCAYISLVYSGSGNFRC